MMKHPLPEGLSESDYEAIEAAVMETVRGRWFLAEFSRRSHIGEMRQMLDAVARLEDVVTNNLPGPADPSIRLLVSRLKQVDAELGALAADMRARGIDEKYCLAVEAQARALGGLLRLNASPDATRLKAPQPEARPAAVAAQTEPDAAALPAPVTPALVGSFEDRLAALAKLDQLPILEKLRIFR